MTQEERRQVESIIKQIIEEMPEISPDDPEREMKIFTYIYSKLATMLVYDYATSKILDELSGLGGYDRERYEDTHPIDPTTQDARAIIHGKAICSGFSDVLQVALEMVGIKSIKIYGKRKDGNHVWNQVCLDGKWYNCDLTNDYDFICAGEKCKYFLKSDAEFPNSSYATDLKKTTEIHECDTSVSDKHQEELINEAMTTIRQIEAQRQAELEAQRQKEMEQAQELIDTRPRNKISSFLKSIADFIHKQLNKIRGNEYGCEK